MVKENPNSTKKVLTKDYNSSRVYRGKKIGQRYGMLTIIDFAEVRKGQQYFWCQCDCGVKRVISGACFHPKTKTKSCGCQLKAYWKKLRTHGESHRTAEYHSWSGLKCRCLNPQARNYTNYGGRGIKVCDRWLDPKKGYKNFLKDMGRKPSSEHSLDRINVNGDYSPSNCRWATHKQQNNNRRKITSLDKFPTKDIIKELYQRGYACQPFSVLDNTVTTQVVLYDGVLSNQISQAI